MGEVGRVPQYVGELGDKVTRMPHVCDSRVVDVFFEGDGVEMRLDSKAAQL